MTSTGVLSQTTTIRRGHEVDCEALERPSSPPIWKTIAGPIGIRQFEGGQSNPTYLLHTPDRDYVLRKKPPGQLLPSAHQVDREYRVMTALQDSGVPVPPTRLLCTDAPLSARRFS